MNPAEVQRKSAAAMIEMGQYFDSHRRSPGADLLSALATDDGSEGRMTDEQLLTTAFLLLIAGHRTTVNLVTNGAPTLLRHDEVLERLRGHPELVIHLVEELLRMVVRRLSASWSRMRSRASDAL